MSKLRPIPLKTWEVQAILEGRKTQTRRVVKPQPSQNVKWDSFGVSALTPENHIEGRGMFEEGYGCKFFKCPYGQPGDILWVRETWGYEFGGGYLYKASHEHMKSVGGLTDHKWKPSIHMPFAAARIFLRVKSVRVERLQDISEKDAMSEGETPAKIYWVWVVEFERISREEALK